MKKLFGVIAALVLAMGLSTTAFADEVTPTGPTIAITNDKSGHVYHAFCIFKGDLNTAGTTLSNIDWGEGVDSGEPTDIYSGLAQIVDDKGTSETGDDVYPFTKAGEDGTDSVALSSEIEVAEALAKYSNNSVVLDKFAEVVGANLSSAHSSSGDGVQGQDGVYTYTITVPGDGYYLVKDQNSYNGETEDAATKFIVQVVKNVTVSAKADVATSDKSIVKADGATGKADDYNVGDTVNFQVTGTIPEMDGYESYTYIVHDTMSEGLTPVDGNDENTDIDVTIQIKKGGQDTLTLTGSDYTFSTSAEGETFALSIDNFLRYKQYAGGQVVVTYAATLDEDALTTQSETNTSYIEFSNNPNSGSTGTGKTTPSVVHVYDFDININKFEKAKENDANSPLAGVKFVLYKLDGDSKALFYKQDSSTKKVEWVDNINYTAGGKASDGVTSAATAGTITEVTTDANGAAKFQGLDAGTYYVLETQALDGYNTLTGSVEVKIEATYKDDGSIDSTSTNVTAPDNNGQPYASISIENKRGSILPSTGGIGTTLFYVVGGTLAVAALVLLVVRKRANSMK